MYKLLLVATFMKVQARKAYATVHVWEYSGGNTENVKTKTKFQFAATGYSKPNTWHVEFWEVHTQNASLSQIVHTGMKKEFIPNRVDERFEKGKSSTSNPSISYKGTF